MSLNGDPGGNWNGKGVAWVLIVWVVEILTTDGSNFSAKSAKEFGICFAYKLPLNKISNTNNFNVIFLKVLI